MLVLAFDNLCDLGKLCGLSDPQVFICKMGTISISVDDMQRLIRADACENVEGSLICKLYKG